MSQTICKSFRFLKKFSKEKGIFQTQEYKTILKECTSNENWNISNSKLQILADHTYNWEDYNVIMKHLWSKVQSKPKDWRRIFKALNAMDYLVKNGAPRVVQDIKDDLYKIRSYNDFSYVDGGTDHGQGGKTIIFKLTIFQFEINLENCVNFFKTRICSRLKENLQDRLVIRCKVFKTQVVL